MAFETQSTNPAAVTQAASSGSGSIAPDTSTGFQIEPHSRGKGVRSLLLGGRSDASVGPAIVGLVIISAVFQTLNSRFLSPENITNLALQVTAVGTIAIGVVLVLLLGEIDVSIAATSGVCGAFLAVLYVQLGWNPFVALGAAILLGACIGGIQGFAVTWLGVPGFIITLAGLMTLGGIQLFLLGDASAINLPFDGPIVQLTTTFFPAWVGWALVAVVLLAYVFFRSREVRRMLASGLPTTGYTSVAVRGAGLAVVLVVGAFAFNQDRGVPLAFVIFVALVVFAEFILKNTRYGKHVFAVGGDVEAARRNGVRVNAIRVSVFASASAFAALGGVLAASRLSAATLTAGAGDVLINAIAAAVIGGTSLFGGRGTVYSALVGILVIGAIANGMNLLSLEPAVKFTVTGIVLALAVATDALTRKLGRSRGGR
jgi:D-xylose transport system permease protein